MRTTHRPKNLFRYTPLVAALACVLVPQAASAASFVVSSGAAFGPGSLNQAIVDANAADCTVANTIDFSGAFTINVSSSLPQINCSNLKINGTSTANKIVGTFSYGSSFCGSGSALSVGASDVKIDNVDISGFPGPAICVGGSATLTGNKLHDNGSGIYFEGGSGTADNNAIFNNSNEGIRVEYGGGISITNNFIGTPDGATPQGNGTGIYLEGSATTVIGNTISDNSTGIYINDNGGSGIHGNWIGTNPGGSAALGSQGTGIYSFYSNPSISNNTISGNDRGIELYGDGTVSGNYIGTNSGGTAAIGNNVGFYGGSIQAGVVVSGNTISANSNYGVDIGDNSGGGEISGNMIGTDSAGNGSMPNGTGIRISSSNGIQVTGNTIAHNSGAGVAVGPQSATISNPITGNRIFANGKNIDLLGDTSMPLLNDGGDFDSGANHGLNHPDITSVIQSGGQTTVDFNLDAPVGTYYIEVFSNPADGGPAGQTVQGNTSIFVSNSGGLGSVTLAGLFDHVSLTATLGSPGSFIETSEFSPMASITPQPAVTVSPTSVSFGAVPVGAASAPRTVSLISSGGAPWILNELSNNACDAGVMCSGSAYMCSTTCVPGTPYSAGNSCSVTATFAPTALGPQNTTIYVCDNTGSMQTVDLSGTGVIPPPITITPNQWDFGRVLVGRVSAVQTFTIVNPGSTPITIGAVSTLGDFTLLATTCGTTIPGPGSCNADVSFKPTQPGLATGSLVVPVSTPPPPPPPSDAALLGGKRAKVALDSASATAALFGTGVQQAQLEMPSVLEFGTIVLGTPGTLTMTAEVRNTGNAFLTFANISITGAQFSMTDNCPLNLAPGASCLLTITFRPTAPGDFAGLVSITSNSSGGLRTISLGGAAQLVAKPVISVAPVSMGFGERVIGTTSPTQRITILNDGGAPATLGAFSGGLEFLVSGSTCGLTLSPQSSCFVDVAMRPLAFGSRIGTFSFTSNAEGSPHRVELNGSGCRPFTTSSNRLGGRSNCSP